MSKDRESFGRFRFHGDFCDSSCPFLVKNISFCKMFKIYLSLAYLPHRHRCDECKEAVLK